MDNHIFALDIGTRSVTGIILLKNENKFTLIDYYTEEHQARTMHDGQIHHVMGVAQTIKNVKETLEKKHGALHKVSIAAAGRSLKTVRSESSIAINEQPITDEEIINHLELSAVGHAQNKILEETDSDINTDFYCVGYSVLSYHIDETQIGSLIDQKGKIASVNIIATFLPKMVIESLLAALERAHLEMEALTLEPIAAINVLIPESMRKLNVALVDIGAGTSDVALTNHGTVIAYGMVPKAGDEITEAISDSYLLDFPVAENAKKAVVNSEKAFVFDILGFETEITYSELVNNVFEKLDELAQTVADKIIHLNHKSPQAVMLIGGGSLTPELPKLLANKLNLPHNRVAIRDINAIHNIEKTDNLPIKPDFVTPIGIAISATENPIHYVNVTVNNKVVRLFQHQQLSIGDALLRAGIETTQFYGRPGMAYFIKVNGKDITLPGSYGEAPNILKNGKQAKIDNPVSSGDSIMIEKGRNGSSPVVTLNDLFGELPSLSFYYNSQAIKMEPTIEVNGLAKSTDYIINDKDNINLKQPKTIKDFLVQNEPKNLPKSYPFYINLNGKRQYLNAGNASILLNGRQATLDTSLNENDDLIIEHEKRVTVSDLLNQLDEKYMYAIEIYFNGKPIKLEEPRLKIMRDGSNLTKDSILNHNDNLRLEENKAINFIFQDIFRYIDLDLSQIKGHFTIAKNGNPTRFDDTLQSGDELTMEW